MVEIALICDDGYFVPTLATIESICASKNEDTKYLIHIISEGLNNYYKSIFKQFENRNVVISFIEEKLGELAEVNEYSSSAYGVATPTALLKFKLPMMIDSDKVLYLDGDLIVREDLSYLFDVDISDYYAGIIVDSGVIYSQRKEMVENPLYFNSGVMLLNLSALRRDNVTDKLIKEKTTNNKTGLMDQDTFNAVFQGHTKTLDICWNCLAINLIRAIINQKYTIDKLKEKYSISVDDLQGLIDSAKIIHFASKDKPWKYYNIPLSGEWYEHYLKACKIVGVKPSLIQREESNFMGWESVYSDKQPSVIVSLTSYPARIKTVYKVIETILAQTMKPDRLMLWLSTEKFPNKEKDLPKELVELLDKGLEIMWCQKDLGPHTKYFYTMKYYRNNIIITVDDDKYYSEKLIEILVSASKRFPGSVCCVRAHMIKMYDKYNFKPYIEWQKGTRLINVQNDIVFPTGVGGVLYPPNCFSDALFDVDTIEKTCLFTDDLWLKWRELKEEIPCVLVADNINPPFVDPDETQKKALYLTNVNNGGNDESWKNILDNDNHISIYGHNVYESIFNQYCSVDFAKIAYIRKLKSEYKRIESSYSYRIGKICTWIPRKARRVYRACQKYGIKKVLQYNLGRIFK